MLTLLSFAIGAIIGAKIGAIAMSAWKEKELRKLTMQSLKFTAQRADKKMDTPAIWR